MQSSDTKTVVMTKELLKNVLSYSNLVHAVSGAMVSDRIEIAGNEMCE